MKKKRRVIIGLALICVLTESAGCGRNLNPVSTETIELIEPVSAVSDTEVAAYRNLYDYKIVPGYVYPYIREYSLSIGARLDEYCVIPGDTVSRGDVLLRADDSYHVAELEQLEESVRLARETYEDGQQGYQDTIASIQNQIAELEEQKRALGNGSPDYAGKLDHQIASYRLAIEQNRMRARHEKELYEMESVHNAERLAWLKQQNSSYVLTSQMNGTVVSATELYKGSWINADTPLVAVADDSQKIFRCAYVSASDIKKCTDLYAFINGERYEVEYQPMDTTEYNRLASQNQTVYSSFVIQDEENKVKNGDYAVLAQIYARSEHVLSVPKNAIHRDETGTFVYRYEDKTPILTRVRTGQTDGSYTEITEGLSEGDEVLLTENRAYGSGTAEVVRGSFSASFEADGYMGYPKMTAVNNPIENGTTYFVELQALRFGSVQKGDVIAKVRVEIDEVALYEKKKALSRQKERLKDAVAAGNELDAKRRREEIERLNEEIRSIEADAATTEIRSEYSGVLVWMDNPGKDSVIAPNAVIAYVADEENSYITVSDEKQQLVLGNTVQVAYTTKDFQSGVADGVVVTASTMGISRSLASDSVYIKLPEDVMSKLSAASSKNQMGFWDRSTYKITASVREMKNVLMIPKSAVWMSNGNNYVYVRNADGTIVARSFVAGGSDVNSYWVLEGLEEGMSLCLE